MFESDEAENLRNKWVGIGIVGLAVALSIAMLVLTYMEET